MTTKPRQNARFFLSQNKNVPINFLTAMNDEKQNQAGVFFSQTKKSTNGLLKRAVAVLNQEQSEMNLKKTQNVIILQNGIYTIRKDLETSNIPQDATLKQLVDSVLQ